MPVPDLGKRNWIEKMKNKKLSIKFLFPLILLAILALINSCKKRPSEVLDEKAMVNLLADMQIAEAYETIKNGGRGNSSNNDKTGERILSENNVTQEEFDSTLSWYGRNLDDYRDLFDKVDLEIAKRQEKIEKESGDIRTESEIKENIWPYTSFGIISKIGNNDGWIVSIDNPPLLLGDRLQWNFHIPEAVGMKGTLGVEYTDGTTETTTNSGSSGNKFELEFQTDTAKTVERLFGYLTLKDRMTSYVYIDSIRLTVLRYDSLSYQNKRGQRRFGNKSSIPPRKSLKKEVADSLSLSDRVAG